MTLYRTSPEPDRSMQWHTGGTGLHSTWMCMGCHKPRLRTGSKGKGIKQRCAVCVAKKEQKQ